MMRRVANLVIWVALLSGVYFLILFQSNTEAGNRVTSHDVHGRQHGGTCPVCLHSRRSLPDEIGADNVHTFLPKQSTSD